MFILRTFVPTKVPKVCGALRWFFSFSWVADYIFCKALCHFFVLLSRQKYQKRLLNVGYGLGSASLFPQRRQPQRLFCFPPQFFLCVTLTTTTYLGYRVKPAFDDKTSRFDIFLESHSYNNTIDAFCPVQFITLVLRGLVSHK